MENETVVAAPSAEVADAFNGENVSFADFSKYRETGELPERFKPAVTADPAPVQEISEAQEAETETDSETVEEQQQEPKGNRGAEFRIKQLLAKNKELERKLSEKQDVRSESSPASEPAKPSQPQNYADWEKAFSPEKWIEQYGKDHPEASYERANAAMFSHMLDVRERFRDVEQQRQSQAKELNDKVADARTRYGENFDEVLAPTLRSIISDQGINPNVKAMLNDSEVIADLLFTIGSDQKTLDEFVRMAKETPGKALRYIAVVEQGIIDELSKPAESIETDRNEKGQFTAKDAPAKPKTSAPKPPVPVTGASTGAFDVSDESLSPEQWQRQRNEQLAKRKG